MARTMRVKTTTLYRTLVRKLTTNHRGEDVWVEIVYGPYDSKSVNQDYDWDRYYGAGKGTRERQVYKQELKPVFNLTPMKGLVLGLEWVTYEQDGVKVHEH